LFDIPSRVCPKKNLDQSRIKIASFALKLSEDWDTRLRRCRVSSMALQSHSQFRRHLHSLLKQLKVSTSQLDILDSVISVVFALHTLREEQNRVEMEPPIVRPPQVGGYLRAQPSPTAASKPPQSSRAQQRKFKQPICWKYAEKGQCLYHSCKKRHVNKEALAVISCPYFEKKGVCRFHEAGTCWYGHGVSVEASPPVNLVVELPDPPLPGSTLLVDVGIPPPLDSAFGVDFGTQTDSWLYVHSGTQTCLLSTSDSEIQTTPALPMVDEMTQTGPVNLKSIITREHLIKECRHMRYLEQGKKAAARKLDKDVDLRNLSHWLADQEREAKQYGLRRKPLRIFFTDPEDTHPYFEVKES